MEATVVRLNGQTRQGGNSELSIPMEAGVLDGLGRAEMRERIERLEEENRSLRQTAAELRESLNREHRALINANIELRVKCGALEELRRGRAGQWCELVELSSKRRQNQDRFMTLVGGAVALGAVAILCMAIIVVVG